MAKKAFAVTNIKHGDYWVNANEEIDTSKFSKDDLKVLYDNGALELREIPDAEPPKVESPIGPKTEVKSPNA